MTLTVDPKVVLRQARDIKAAIELLQRALDVLLDHKTPTSGILTEIQYAKSILERLK